MPAMLLAVVLALFGPAIAAGVLLAPGDGIAQYFPQRVLIAASLRAGEWPFWNPAIFGGMPLFAAIQGGVCFPGNWGFLFLTPVWAMNLAVAAAYAVAGWGMLAYGRAIGLGRSARWIAAVSFALGGFMVAHLEHLAMIQAAGLLPWELWAIERFVRDRRRRDALGLAGLLALQVLAGHPQTVAFGLLLAGPYALFRAGTAPAHRRAGTALALVLALGGGLALAFFQIWPMADLLAQSPRQALSYAQLVDHSLPPRQLVTLLAPFAFGGVPGAWFPTPYWGAGPWRNELVGYTGVVTAILALVGLGAWRRSALVRFWTIAAGAALALALGGFTPLYRVWALVPLLDTMRVPARHLMAFDLAIAVLAGLGWQALQSQAVPASAERAGRPAWLFPWLLVGAPLLALWAGVGLVGGRLAAHWQALMPAGISLADALRPAQPAFWAPVALWAIAGAALALPAARPRLRGGGLAFLVTLDLFVFASQQGWAALSHPLPAPWRGGAPIAWAPYRTLSLAASPYPYHDWARLASLDYPLIGALSGVRAVGGYEPLIPARYAALAGGMSHGGAMSDPAIWSDRGHALDVLGARWLRVEAARVASDAPLRAALATPRWRLAGEEAGVRSYENSRALPRAWRVSSASVLPAAAVDARVRGEAAFDPAREALLEPPPGSAAPRGRWWPGRASARQASLNRLSVSTEGAGPGLVVVSEGYDPGWRATTASGERLPVYRADGLVMAVAVPAGAVSFELSYEPRRWRAGLLGAAAALLLGLLVLARRPAGREERLA